MAVQDEYLTIPEVVKLTKCSKSWVYLKIKSGELPSVVLPGGRLLRVPATALTATLASKKTDSLATE